MTTALEFQNNFPFITCIRVNGVEYTGIIINSDANITSIYDYSIINTIDEKKKFLELGETWWWESNRRLPINIFLKQDMINYRIYIKTFNSKDTEFVFGPVVNLSELAEKRIKRKSIQLIRSSKKSK